MGATAAADPDPDPEPGVAAFAAGAVGAGTAGAVGVGMVAAGAAGAGAGAAGTGVWATANPDTLIRRARLTLEMDRANLGVDFRMVMASLSGVGGPQRAAFHIAIVGYVICRLKVN